jgi:phage tail-like protein
MNVPFELPVAFYFNVKLVIDGAEISDTSFSEVSGMSSSLQTEEYKENGNNRYTYYIPTGVKYTNLVLKRGIAPLNSGFTQWCMQNMMQEGIEFITTGTLYVSLLNAEGSSACQWVLSNAYPIKWTIDQFNSTKNSIAFETIEIIYSYLSRTI